MSRKFLDFLKDEDGATFIEYGVIIGFLSVAVILAVGTLTDTLAAMLDYLSGVLLGIDFTQA